MADSHTTLIIGPCSGHEQNQKSVLLTQTLMDVLKDQPNTWLLSPKATPRGHMEASLTLGEHRQMVCFDSTVDPQSFSQLNQEFLTNAFPKLLRQLKPGLVHFVDPHLLGLELLWIVRKTWPASTMVASFSDASALCELNGLLVNTKGKLCSGPSISACQACKPELSTAQGFLRQDLLRSALQLLHVVTGAHQRFSTALEGLGARVHSASLSPTLQKDAAVQGHAPKQAKPEAAPVAYFGPVTGEGLRLIVEAARLASPTQGIHIYPTDLDGTDADRLLDKYRQVDGISIQSNWEHANFSAYLQQYTAVILPDAGSAEALHWAEAALAYGAHLILPSGLLGLDPERPNQLIGFLSGSAMSLSSAIHEAHRRIAGPSQAEHAPKAHFQDIVKALHRGLTP